MVGDDPRRTLIPRMAIAREEVFGHVLRTLGYDSLDEAVAIANDTYYGLSSAVRSTAEQTMHHVARRLRAGQVIISRLVLGTSCPKGRLFGSGPMYQSRQDDLHGDPAESDADVGQPAQVAGDEKGDDGWDRAGEQ